MPSQANIQRQMRAGSARSAWRINMLERQVEALKAENAKLKASRGGRPKGSRSSKPKAKLEK